MKGLFAKITLCLCGTLAVLPTMRAQSTVMTEDFSGTTNIFGITSTTLTAGKAAIHDTGLTGFGRVLAVCNTTAEGTISGSDNQPVDFSERIVTAEWDAFHGYFGNSRSTTVSLINSEGSVIASYTYTSSNCQVTAATIGGEAVAGFEAFALQGANGFGGNGKPYTATGNPHIAVSMTGRGGVTMVFSKNGSVVKTLLGSTGTLTKNMAKLRITTNVENTDRCYAIDNIKVTAEELVIDPNYVEPIAHAIISGAERMTFGPSPDEAFSNPYTVSITGADGTTITEGNLSEKVTDFKVVWNIEGFQTANDTEGQYCDSYGAFSTNSEGKVSTTFDLCDVPMNFYGRMTATITYNGTTTTAEKYVVALGDLNKPTTQVLPLAGYPADFKSYPDALNGYKLADETYGTANDLIVGGWCVAGSDSHVGTLMADANGNKYVRLTASTLKKSHVLTQQMEALAGQNIYATRLRFNSAGAIVTLTGGSPFWASSKYTCPVTLNFDGTHMTLNGTTLTLGDATATFTTGTWYDIVLSADKSSERCYVLIYNTNQQLLGETAVLPWAEASNPTFFSIGMGNNNLGSVDMAACKVFQPTIQPDRYTLTADKTTLSIPQGEQAQLSIDITDENGYAITQQATWSVVEEDMQQSIVLTPDQTDSHKAVATLSSTAEAGTATIQVNVGGTVKTLAITLTSSAESIKFTRSTTSISIPMDDDTTAKANFSAIVIDGEGNNLGRSVTLAAYDKEGIQPYTFGQGITFDATTGILTVTSSASPAQFTIRATGANSDGKELTKSVKVSLHGLKFDFGVTDDEGIAAGFTPVGAATSYSATHGYGIVSGSPTVQGTASDTDATADYLQGAVEFDVKVEKGCFYTVAVTYQGTLTTGYVNTDLAGYTLGTHQSLTTDTYTIPATLDKIDLHVANADATHVAQIAQITITKQTPRSKRDKRVVHHIGDSTSANNGSWAYRLKNLIASTYPQLAALCTFHNDGAGGRNLSTYYTEGKLAIVLRDIYPGDIVMFGNNGTNGMGQSYEADMNYYLDAAEALGARIIINSYTPHGAVGNYAGGYNAATHTFDSYRKDSYETIVRQVATERANSDSDYIGFVEIGKNADAIFNAYVADYKANGYASADAAAQAIIQCFADHNHYNKSTLACDLMLNGYANVKGIVQQLAELLTKEEATRVDSPAEAHHSSTERFIYTLTGQRMEVAHFPGIYIVGNRKVILR